MTIIAFLLGLTARGASMAADEPLSYLLLVLGIALIFIEGYFWIRHE